MHLKILCLHRDQKGAAAVEFAMVIPVFLIFMFGIISFTQAFWIRNTMQYAVDEAGRYAMINTGASNSDITSYFQSKVYGMSSAGITVSISSATVSSVTYKTISATYSFAPFNNGLIDIPAITLSTQARVPIIP